MIIRDLPNKIKSFWGTRETIILVVILVGCISFGLGRLSASEYRQIPVWVEQGPATALEGHYVASEHGSAYHFPWCSGADRILAENKVWFNSKEEAEAHGYRPAGNCKGL